MTTAQDAPAQSTSSMSRGDLAALHGSGRGKVVLLAGVMVAALGAAAFAFWPSGGIGNPEDPAKVMIVTEDGARERFLDEMGFDADGQTFDALEAKANAEVDGLEAQGVAAIMTLADQFGFGYVVFERPQQLDFDALEIESMPAFGEDVRYAVISVGDLADPPKVTTGRGLLETLFAQDRLAELVPPNEPEDVDAVELRDKLREGIDALTRVPQIQLPRRRF